MLCDLSFQELPRGYVEKLQNLFRVDQGQTDLNMLGCRTMLGFLARANEKQYIALWSL